MKRLLVLLSSMALVFGTFIVSNAELIDRGGGLIYDTVLDITWLQVAGSMSGTWDEAKAWVDGFTYYDAVREVTWDDWRLPILAQGDGYNNTAGELGHLYYITLGNLGYEAPDGTSPQPGWGLQNTGPFISLTPAYYWSGTGYWYNPSQQKLAFSFYDGVQNNHFYSWDENYQFRAWAVRDGDVGPPPQPPVANAGPDQTVNEGEKVTLDGTGSTDPDDVIVSYLWEQLDGPEVTLTGANTFLASFTAPNVGPSVKVLTFQLTVTDSGGLQGTDTCKVSVEPFPWELFIPALIRGK
jgi:hypothetical protein